MKLSELSELHTEMLTTQGMMRVDIAVYREMKVGDLIYEFIDEMKSTAIYTIWRSNFSKTMAYFIKSQWVIADQSLTQEETLRCMVEALRLCPGSEGIEDIFPRLGRLNMELSQVETKR